MTQGFGGKKNLLFNLLREKEVSELEKGWFFSVAG
jgi:hypothetical protein